MFGGIFPWITGVGVTGTAVSFDANCANPHLLQLDRLAQFMLPHTTLGQRQSPGCDWNFCLPLADNLVGAAAAE
jgi:hypothetical protein